MKNITWMMSPRNTYSDQDSMSWVVIDVSAGPVGGIAVIVATKNTCVKSLMFSMVSMTLAPVHYIFSQKIVKRL